MPEPIENLTRGMPVEIGRIERELKRLWQEGEGAATRASLINFAVYCEGAESMRQTTGIIAEITADHACRAILINVDEEKQGARVEAWISAHCHLSRAGAKQVCCEQITFQLARDGRPLIPNIVFTNLDSDLPLVLWWRGDFPAQAEEQLWRWVDRLIFDSQAWGEPRKQLELLQGTIAPLSPRITLCDLNWTRSLNLRQAVAQIFDHPEYLAELPGLKTVEITHAPGMCGTALLVGGWLAGQMKWTLVEARRANLSFKNQEGSEVKVTLREQEGAPLGGITLESGGAAFKIMHHENSGFLHADIDLAEGRQAHLLLPGGKSDLVSLLDNELMSGGRHRVYLKAARIMSAAL